LALDTWVLADRLPDLVNLIVLVCVGAAIYALSSKGLNQAIFRDTIKLIYK
jgi:hypothetical protein